MSFLWALRSNIKGPSNFGNFIVIELVVVFVVIWLGTIGFHYVEWWALFDSLYFIVVTMATIGYGDFVPVTNVGKAFAMFYAVMGVPLFVYTTSMILDYRFKAYIDRYQKIVDSQKEKEKTAASSSGFAWFRWLFDGSKEEHTVVEDKSEHTKEEVSEVSEWENSDEENKAETTKKEDSDK